MSEIEMDDDEKLELEMQQKLAGRRGDTAMMLDNGTVIFRSTAHHADRRPSRMTQELTPEDPDYKKICEEFGISKPGDSATKSYKWNGSDWEAADPLKTD